MHITVVADKSGKIVGLAFDAPGSVSERTHSTALAAGLSAHENDGREMFAQYAQCIE